MGLLKPGGFHEARLEHGPRRAGGVASAGNSELARIHHGITERIRILRRIDFTHAERVIYTYMEHAQILRAILARKAARAIELLRSHIEQSKSEVRKISLHRLHLAHLDARGRA